MQKNTWIKASLSSGGDNCVEVMQTIGGVLVRDSKYGDDSPVLGFTPSEWEAFVGGAQMGEFDV
jgi:hypothetical protein